MAKAANDAEVAFLRSQLANLDAQRAAVEARLAAVLEPGSESDPIVPPTAAARKRIAQEKIAIFRRLFAGRPTSLHCDGRTQKTVALATRQPVQTNGPLEFAENRKSSAAHARTKPSHLTFLQVNRFIRRAPFGRHAREKAFGRPSILAG